MQSKLLSKTEEREEERGREKRKETNKQNTEMKLLAIKISFIQDFFNVLQTTQRETHRYTHGENFSKLPKMGCG